MTEALRTGQCYRHSGRVPGKALVGGLAVAVGLGLAVGGGVAKVLCKWEARSRAVAMGLGLLGAAVAQYGAWVGYVFALNQYWKQGLPLSAIARPDILWAIIQDLYETGVWSISGNDTPKGVILALVWLTEAGVVLVTAGKFARRVMNKRVYCEHCQKWGSEKRE